MRKTLLTVVVLAVVGTPAAAFDTSAAMAECRKIQDSLSGSECSLIVLDLDIVRISQVAADRRFTKITETARILDRLQVEFPRAYEAGKVPLK